MSSRALVERYHDAWKQHDFDTARSLLHDDLSFHGPIDTFERADDYIDALKRLQPMVESVETERVFADGELGLRPREPGRVGLDTRGQPSESVATAGT